MDALMVQRGQVRQVRYGNRVLECQVVKAVSPGVWVVTTADVLDVQGVPTNRFIAQVQPSFNITGVSPE